MRNGIYTDEELSSYAQAWDRDSAAEEVELGRIADAYEAGMLVPAEDEPITVPLPAFLIMCVVAIVLVATVLLVG